MTRTFETRREAEEWARITEGKVTGGEVIQTRTPVTLAQACAWGKTHLTTATRHDENVQANLRYWATSKFAAWAIHAIHDWDLIDWRKEVLDEEGDGEGQFSAQTCIHRLNALSKLIQTWGRAHRIVIDSPVKPGVRPGKPQGRSRRLSEEEEKILLARADRCGRPWLRPCIIIALETAMRQSEQHGLEWTDIDLARGYADLRRTKNNRARRVPLSARAIAAFGELKAFPRPVPVETRHGIIQAFIDAREGLADLRWHDLRHEAICRLFENTDFRDHEIMAISGHLTPSMLSRYTHLRADRLTDRLPGGRLHRVAIT